jgi:hypothetical protein
MGQAQICVRSIPRDEIETLLPISCPPVRKKTCFFVQIIEDETVIYLWVIPNPDPSDNLC